MGLCPVLAWTKDLNDISGGHPGLIFQIEEKSAFKRSSKPEATHNLAKECLNPAFLTRRLQFLVPTSVSQIES